MPYLLRLCVLCLAIVVWARAAEGQTTGSVGSGWTNSGPDRVSSLAVSPADGAVYAVTTTPVGYTGSISAIYRSSDHGATWSQVGPTFPLGPVPDAIALDATNALYIAMSQDGGVFKSVDGGVTRMPLTGGLPPACYDPAQFAIAPSQPSTIYLSRCGLYRSVDAGATWKAIASPQGFVSALVMHPNDPGRVLAGTDKVWLSDDAGETWRPAAFEPGNLVQSVVFDPTSPSKVLATVDGAYEVARSEDGGKTWVQSRDGYLGYGASAVLFDPRDPTTVYVTAHGWGALPTTLPPPPCPCRPGSIAPRTEA